ADMVMAGKLAMMRSGIWETPRFRNIKSFDWDVAMFPKGPVKRAFGSGGSGYCIVRTTKHPEEAWEVLKALSGDYGQEMLARGGLAQPANMRIAGGEYWAKSPEKPLNKKMLNEAVRYTMYEPFNPLWQEAQSKYLGSALDMFFNNEITSGQFARDTVPKLNSLMFRK
ncbi:MAG: extracellular solute-binding protein, partial [bacterium]|nr:extracellular solute-binding protein [bacterium]